MKLENPYSVLGEHVSVPSIPAAVSAPEMVCWNTVLAENLGLEIDPDERAEVFSGNRILPGTTPVALGYAGHQFGQFVPQLGDGRAHLLGACLDHGGRHWDLQLKGSGTTLFSRGGDGRCAIGPAVREFIMSEALHFLGVPTTRTLSVVATGDPVYRDRVLPGAIVTRVAASHIRVGSFQYLALREDATGLAALLELAIARHYPDIVQTGDERILAFFERVMDAQIHLVTHWMRVGFIHGVMNTDNTLVSGETIDYGPCAMMNRFDFDTVFSSIDRHGRYAFGNQPNIVHWNLARLAESLLGLFDAEEERAVQQLSALLNEFSGRFNRAFSRMWADKLGIVAPSDEDQALSSRLLTLMQEHALDYTNTFDVLTESLAGQALPDEFARALGDWYTAWQARIPSEQRGRSYVLMRAANPRVIPRNHRVEAIITEFEESGKSEEMGRLMEVLSSPYHLDAKAGDYQSPPVNGDLGYKTFCGT